MNCHSDLTFSLFLLLFVKIYHEIFVIFNMWSEMKLWRAKYDMCQFIYNSIFLGKQQTVQARKNWWADRALEFFLEKIELSSSLIGLLIIITSHILQNCVWEANYKTTNIRTIRNFLLEQNLTLPTKILNNDMSKAVLLPWQWLMYSEVVISLIKK